MPARRAPPRPPARVRRHRGRRRRPPTPPASSARRARRLRGGRGQRVALPIAARRPEHRRRVHLAGRRRDEDVVGDAQVASSGVRLAEGGLREGDGAPDPAAYVATRIAKRAVEGQRPGQRTGCSPRRAAVRSTPRDRSRAPRRSESPRTDRRPAARTRARDAIRGRDRQSAGCARPRGSLGDCEVEVERGTGAAQPWMSQPSASRAASMTASDSVGWPWTIRAISAKPPSSARTLTSSWMSSVARVPTMWPPSSSP